MLTRTWPYGMTKTVTVEEVLPLPGQVVAICTEQGTHEGFMLQLAACDAQKGEQRQIVFKEGGPMGGFWDFLQR